ncbi:MAG TPA: amidohydrolase family protein [Acidimicrobiales bacterium]|jgi:predicted TIM-barrel fold metal-dependent hydrolase
MSTDFARTRWGYVYDGDQHIHEPQNFWIERLPSKYKDRVPRTVTGSDGKDYYQSADGTTTVGTDMRTAVAGVSELDWHFGPYAFGEIRPSAWDPKARLDDMDIDYVYAAIIHPNRQDFGLFAGADAELQNLCVRIYNDWMSEFCSVDTDRLLGMAQVPSTGVDSAIAELRRVRDLAGIRGVVLRNWPSGEQWPTPTDDAFWYEAEALGMPIIIHRTIGAAGMGAGMQWFAEHGGKYKEALTLGHLQLERLGSAFVPALSYMIIGGVLERCPDLHLVGTETGCGWVPFFLEQSDDNFLRHRFYSETGLTMLPSDYYRRQCWNTFQVDRAAIENRLGLEDKFIWSSDFPHAGADWPNSVKNIEKNLMGVPASEQKMVLTDNCRRALKIG